MYRPEYPSTDLTLDHPAPDAVGDRTTTVAYPTPTPSCLHDVQSEPDTRGIAIEQVGVSGLRYPLTFRDRATEPQQTIAILALSVALPAAASVSKAISAGCARK